MIEYAYQVDMPPLNESEYTDWFIRVAKSEDVNIGEICFVFMDDESLIKINREYLNHDYYTDIITFDYSEEETISGDVMISFDRIKENAVAFGVSQEMELKRVMVHGILHLIGYKDKTEEETAIMRMKEDKKVEMFHVEQ